MQFLFILFIGLLLPISHVNGQVINDLKEPSLGFRPAGEAPMVSPFAYRGEPVKYGSFRLWSNVTFEQIYNDNIFATENNEQGDFATFIKPELIVQKNVGRHEFLGVVNAEIRRYSDETSENIENYNAVLQGNLEARRGLNIPIRLSYQNSHIERQGQTRASLSDIPVNPLESTTAEIESGFVFKPNRFSLSLLGKYGQNRLEDGVLSDGTVLLRENRNVDRVGATLRVSYDYSDIFQPFVSYNYSQEDYIDEVAGAISRNNDFNSIQIGTFFDYRGIIIGSLGAQWQSLSYESEQVDDSSGLSFNGNVTVNPSPKTQFNLNFSRDRVEDNIIVAGLVRDAAGLNLTYEIKRNFFGTVGISYEHKDFEDIIREDDTYGFNLGFNYIFNPRFQFGTEYEYVNRDSTITGIDLDNSILFLRARFAL